MGQYQPPSWYWLVDMIDHGFTEKQVFEEFSADTINRYRAYLGSRAGAKAEMAKMAKQQGGGGQRSPSGKPRLTMPKRGSTVTMPAKSAW